MATLDSTLRDRLATVIGKENTDGGARALAAAGARAAIEALAVHLAAPYGHQDDASRQLRNRIRARARQLGDIRHVDGRHEIDRLVEQAAYEHWHRMLFARFLAENELLIHPEMRVAVTLAECAEMAASEGATDGWELAGRYASRMLPQIFRPDDPLLAVRFALDDVRKLEDLLDSLPAELFRASDSLGWCYQFWQARRKKEVNASEVKIGADELPAVTQLFTEPYMVQFLLQNTLAAWWIGAGRTLPTEMPYLRLLDDGKPAAGTFETWPRTTAELKVLDPCCGSGHFLVQAFEILVKFRMAEEGVGARDACDAVLRDNLFGLEIDARCVQIAAFALALAAWTFPEAGGYRPLAAMNVACSGIAISARKDEWERLGGTNTRISAGMGCMWELFKDAPLLGSLIDPTRAPIDPMFTSGHDELSPLLDRALRDDRPESTLDDHEEMVAARGIADSFRILCSHHTLVVTNVPYLGKRDQSERLLAYATQIHAPARADLATVFIDRLLRLCAPGQTVAVVSPQNWWQQYSYTKFRCGLLRAHRLDFLAALGEEAWQTFGARGPRATLSVLSVQCPHRDGGVPTVDAQAVPSIEDKCALLRSGPMHMVSQAALLEGPDARIVFSVGEGSELLSRYARPFQGIVTGDDPRYRRTFWEMRPGDVRWRPIQSTAQDLESAIGLHGVVWWGNQGRDLARLQGAQAWGLHGVMISQMRSLLATVYAGGAFDVNASAIVTDNPDVAVALWAYCQSGEYQSEVRRIDKKVNVTTATLCKVPFDYSRWLVVGRNRYPNGLPALSSRNPTQSIFAGSIPASEDPLQVAVAQLLSFRWAGQESEASASHADVDGIVCIPAVRGERPASDRLVELLAAAWVGDWHPQMLTDLLAASGHDGDLETWLRDEFFRQHCELFHHRPFIWHIWDGHREGFSALVNYHRLDHETLKSLTYTYLGDWIRNQEVEAKAGKTGAGDKLAKAKVLQQRLALILEGEAPLDVFVRWKPIEQQAIGWEPDLDDGVRLNIRPFLTVATVGAKGAGVLRCRPNIKWGVDRGKNPEGSPWGAERDNDRHVTVAEKRKARGPT